MIKISDLLLEHQLDDGKAVFDDVYNADDPRGYFEELGSLDYVIPHHGQQMFRSVLAAQADQRSEEPSQVLDVCCSYGVNAALLKCDLTLSELENHYRDSDNSNVAVDELADADREFYARHSLPDAPNVAGLDIAANAVDYAEQVGLLDQAFAENLEAAPPSLELTEHIENTDLVTVTGGIGYVTATTFERIFESAGDVKPWLAAFALRRYSYNDIADALAQHGFVTERLIGTTFPQRSFASDEEREFTLDHLESAGLETAGREDDGWFHTEFYLSRPAAEAAETPLSELLGEPRSGIQLQELSSSPV